MTAATVDRATTYKSASDEIRSCPVADNVIVVKGALVSQNASGYAVTSADTASTKCVGIAMEHVDNTTTGHTAGGKQVRVRSGCEVLLNGVSLTQASVGLPALIVDNQTVQTGATTNSIHAGLISQYVSATSCWVDIPAAGVGA
jgi:hypothetical protein